MRGIQRAFSGPLRWLAQAGVNALTAMRHARVGMGWFLLNRTQIRYENEVEASANSIVVACIRWVQRVFSEAPPILQQWAEEREDWNTIPRDRMLSLLERPNIYYNGTTLWKATVADLMLTGNAYWIKVRNSMGQVIQLWWAPQSLMEPKDDPSDSSVFISHYVYKPNGDPIPVRDADVVHFRDGIDPANPRKGLSAMRSLFREIFTDDEAANMTASLLRNMGVPGVIIAPDGSGTISEPAAKKVKESFMAKFTGDKKGEPMVMEGATKIQQFGFSPEQMQLRSLRGIPEERITAVLGVNAAVVGLGAGLATTKVGATLREYREEAFESTIIPMYRELASELTHQLLADFKSGDAWRMAFDLTKVRVLQDDEDKRAERLNKMLEAGGITVAEYRRKLGFVPLPEHEIYLRRRGVDPVPTGLTPEQQADGARNMLPSRSAPTPPSASEPAAQALALRRDAEVLEGALANRLAEPDVDRPAAVQAHYLLTAQRTFASLGATMDEASGARILAAARQATWSEDDAPEAIARQQTKRAQDLAAEMARGVMVG